MATPTKTEEKKLPTFQMNFCDSAETLDALIQNNMINEDELYYFPDPIPSAANNVALLGVDGRILDSTKQFTPAGIGADPVGTGLYSSFVDIPESVDLNDYTACGYYRCTTTNIAKTITNSPEKHAFILIISSSTGRYDSDAISGQSNKYRLQRWISYEGAEYLRFIQTDSSGTVYYNDWNKILHKTDWASLKAEITPDSIGADPLGTGLYTSFTDIPENADLNDYTACGYYACGLSTTAKTISNIPDQDAFSLIVYSSLGNTSDAGVISGKTWKYRLQRFIAYSGIEYVRQITTNGSGTVSYGSWKEFAFTTDTVAAANAVVDYNKSSKQIKIGWNGDSLTASNLKYLAGYNTDGNIKDVSVAAALNLLGIESGTWTPTVAGASSYSIQVGQYLKIGKMVVLSFQIYGVFSGSISSSFKISGTPYSPTTSGHASGGGHLSGYTVESADIVFTGWNIQTNGNIYAVGQHATGTAGGNKWGSGAISQKASGDFMASGTIAFPVA